MWNFWQTAATLLFVLSIAAALFAAFTFTLFLLHAILNITL